MQFVLSLSSSQHVTSMTCYPQWQNNRPALESSGDRILEALKKGTAVAANPGESPPLAPDVAKNCFKQLANSYEEEYGGFRDAPKFPTPGRLGRKHSGYVTPHSLSDSLSLPQQWIWCSSCRTGVWIAPPQMGWRLFGWPCTRSAWWRWEASTTMWRRFIHVSVEKQLFI